MPQTSLPDFLSEETDATGVLRTFSGLKKTGGESAGIQVDIFLNWPIRTKHDAKQLEKLISAAPAMYDDRDSRDDDDPAKADYVVSRKFKDHTCHVTLTLAQDGEGSGPIILSDQGGQLLHVKFKTSKKAAHLEAKIRLFGLTSAQVGDLARGLSEHVGMLVSADQQSLFGDNNVIDLEERKSRIVPKIGQFVAGVHDDGGEFAGQITMVSDDEEADYLFEVKDIGCPTIEVTLAEIKTSITVVPPRGKTVESMLKSYETKAGKKKTRASVAAIIQALGAIHSLDVEATEAFTLSAQVVTEAAKIDLDGSSDTGQASASVH